MDPIPSAWHPPRGKAPHFLYDGEELHQAGVMPGTTGGLHPDWNRVPDYPSLI